MSIPLIILNSPAVSDVVNSGSNPKFGTSRDIAGIVLWSLGWVIETVADAQKVSYTVRSSYSSCAQFRYKQSKQSPKDKPIQVSDSSECKLLNSDLRQVCGHGLAILPTLESMSYNPVPRWLLMKR